LCDRVIPEDGVSTENPSSVKKLVFCSGKVYYDLMKARNEKNLDRDVAIARVEQVQIIFFCCKIHLFGLFKYSRFISLMVQDFSGTFLHTSMLL